MLKIYRYLATASAVLLILALMLVAWFYNQQATRDLVEMATKHSIAIDKILSRVIWSRYEDFLLSAEDMDTETLRSREETREIARLLDGIMTGIHVLKVKLYSPEGRILFSSDPAEIGGDYSESAAVRRAVREGRPSRAPGCRRRACRARSCPLSWRSTMPSTGSTAPSRRSAASPRTLRTSS